MSIPIDLIPEALRERKQWVLWRYEIRGQDKPTKVPLTIGGYHASSTDRCDWYTLEQCLEKMPRAECDGIGFVFADDDPFCGIDLDDCLASPGELKPWAIPIMQMLDGTYAEVSPSGNGIKIFCRAKNPLPSGRKVSCGDGAIEIYDHGRFFTVTGHVWDESPVIDMQVAVDEIARQYLSKQEPTTKNLVPGTNLFVADKIERARKYLATMEPSVSGSHGHDDCFRAACKMVLGFDLTPDEAYLLLATEFSPRCSPPWSEKELRHKVEQANKQSGERGYLLNQGQSFLQIKPGVDLSGMLGRNLIQVDDEPDDEEFFASMIPDYGIIREIFDYYWRSSYKRTNAIGLAIAVSICQTLFGRRIQSHTTLRTNDYNLVVAATSSGKEACRTVTQSILKAAHAATKGLGPGDMLLAPGVQSGNALMKEISTLKCGLWVCDEFGKELESILDKKSNNVHAKKIGKNLLQLYGASNSSYDGDSHTDGRRNAIVQPHLCLLGMTTGDVFNSLGVSQIHDGLYGRLTIWPVQTRPKRSKQLDINPVPESLIQKIAAWMRFQPGFEGQFPDPVVLEMEPSAKDRWENHVDQIDNQMDQESELRAAVWARVGARSMKYALVHRAARFDGDPQTLIESPIEVEMIDVVWGIRLSNWFARLSCGLVKENVVDRQSLDAQNKILEAINLLGEVKQSWLIRKYRKFTAGDFRSAASELERDGRISVRNDRGDGAARRDQWVYFPRLPA